MVDVQPAINSSSYDPIPSGPGAATDNPLVEQNCPPDEAVPSFASHAGPQLSTGNCNDCHSRAPFAGNLDLSPVFADPTNKAFLDTWKAIIFRVENKTMPPTGFSKVSACDVAKVKRWFAATFPEASPGIPAPELAAANPFTCSTPTATPSDQARLTVRELRNTLVDLFVFDPSVVAAIEPTLANLPEGNSRFDSLDSRAVSPAYLDGYRTAVDALTEAVALDPVRLNRFLPRFAQAATRNAAIDSDLIQDFGQLALRGGLTVAEKQFYRSLYDFGAASQAQDGVKMVLSTMLQSSRFLYKKEISGTPTSTNPKLLTLTPAELAVRLSYTIWGSMPDQTLLGHVLDSSLLNPATYQSEIDRMMLDSKTRRHSTAFYEQWLSLRNVPVPPQSSILPGLSRSVIHSEALSEVRDFVEYVTWDLKGNFGNLLRSGTSFVPGSALAQVYGITPSTQVKGKVEFDPARRAGLLMKAAVLLGSSAETNPLPRAAKIRQDLLCDVLAPPPNDLPPGSLLPPPTDPLLTTRQRYEAKTAGEPCYGCHAKFNALGFALEDQSTLGSLRAVEVVMDADGLPKELPLDTTVDPRLAAPGERPVTGSLGLANALAESPKANACFVRQWLRFSAGRAESPNDSCLLKQMYDDLVVSNGSIAAMMSRIFLVDMFKLRLIND